MTFKTTTACFLIYTKVNIGNINKRYAQIKENWWKVCTKLMLDENSNLFQIYDCVQKRFMAWMK